MKKIRLGFVLAISAMSFLATTASVRSVKAETSRKWGFINVVGKMMIEPEYLDAHSFSDGLALVKVSTNGEELYGFINGRGELKIGANFKNAGDFAEGLAAVQLPDSGEFLSQFGAESAGKWGWIDKTGNFVIKPQFDNAKQFSDGLAAATNGGAYGYVDKSGSWAIKPQFYLACPFSSGRAAVLVNEQTGFLSISSSTDKYRASGGHWYYIDKDGKFAFGSFDDCGIYDNGLAPVALGRHQGSIKPDRWGFVDTRGKFVIAPKFNDVRAMSDKMAAVQTGSWTDMGQGFRSWSPGKWGYINESGKQVIDSQFDHADPFSEGMAAVEVNGKWGYIDKKGKIVIEPQFIGNLCFANELAPVLIEKEVTTKESSSGPQTNAPQDAAAESEE